mmetsp:Transcript_43895/g.91900  ORF Transcript_43895/g.91900 Transcript_43895/m.91900 type:complete len:207 (-) Transcript_43895:165-785(-)
MPPHYAGAAGSSEVWAAAGSSEGKFGPVITTKTDALGAVAAAAQTVSSEASGAKVEYDTITVTKYVNVPIMEAHTTYFTPKVTTELMSRPKPLDSPVSPWIPVAPRPQYKVLYRTDQVQGNVPTPWNEVKPPKKTGGKDLEPGQEVSVQLGDVWLDGIVAREGKNEDGTYTVVLHKSSNSLPGQDRSIVVVPSTQIKKKSQQVKKK